MKPRADTAPRRRRRQKSSDLFWPYPPRLVHTSRISFDNVIFGGAADAYELRLPITRTSHDEKYEKETKWHLDGVV